MTKAFVAKGFLLSREALEGLAESKSLEDLAVKLKGTVYSEAVSRLQPPYMPSAFESAFREHLAYIHFKLMKTSPKSELLSAYYLKYIAWNLKTVLKSKAQDRSYDEIVGHLNLYAEELLRRRDLIVRALSATDLNEAVGILKRSEFASEAQSALKAFRETGRHQVFDVYIDRAFYSKVLDAFTREGRDNPWVRSIVAVDIDSYNTLAVLRGRLWNLTPRDIQGLIVKPTFSVKAEDLKAVMEAETLSDGLKVLLSTPYRDLVPQPEAGEEALAVLEDSFRILSYRRAAEPFIWDVHSMSVPIGLVKMKELEARNLSAIAFGVSQGLSLHEIVSRLTLLA